MTLFCLKYLWTGFRCLQFNHDLTTIFMLKKKLLDVCQAEKVKMRFFRFYFNSNSVSQEMYGLRSSTKLSLSQIQKPRAKYGFNEKWERHIRVLTHERFATSSVAKYHGTRFRRPNCRIKTFSFKDPFFCYPVSQTLKRQVQCKKMLKTSRCRKM